MRRVGGCVGRGVVRVKMERSLALYGVWRSVTCGCVWDVLVLWANRYRSVGYNNGEHHDWSWCACGGGAVAVCAVRVRVGWYVCAVVVLVVRVGG